MKKTLKYFIIFLILLSSCDFIVPPFVTNGYSYTVILNISINESEYNINLKSGLSLLQRRRGTIIKTIKILSENKKILAEYTEDIINQVKKNKKIKDERYIVTEKGLYLLESNIDWKNYILIHDPDYLLK
jgi:hypothetical protein